ncbi:MAG: DUF4340 domain-containing protein [Verrucomicrobia bacterium]|nr:DUF4340 domain-containing protein [Verrucomicrobiota bacterium]
MNQKQLNLLLIVAIIVVGISFFVLKSGRSSWKSSAAGSRLKVLADFPINDIEQVRIAQSSGGLNLVKKDGVWRVRERYDYPANFTQISDFLRKLWELKAVQWMAVGSSQYKRLELVSPDDKTAPSSGTLVELRNASGKMIKSLVLGKKHMRQMSESSPFGGSGGYPDSRYVLTLGESKDVALVSELFSEVEPKSESWLDKTFFKVENPKEIAVTSKESSKCWRLTRDTETADWKLDGAKSDASLDSAKVSSAASALSSPSFNDVVAPQTKPEDAGLNMPTLIAIKTFDGFSYTVKIGKVISDAYHLQVKVDANFSKTRVPGKDEKPADKERLDREFKEKLQKLEEKAKTDKECEPWTYLVSKWTIDSLLKERKDLLVEKKDDKKSGKESPKK